MAYRGYLLADDGGIAGVQPSLAVSEVTGINLKATGPTTLFTVPTGKTLAVLACIVRVTAADTIAVPATVRAGKTANYNQIVGATVLTGLTALGGFIDLTKVALLQVQTVFAAGEVVALDVTAGATATTAMGAVVLVGVLF